MGVCADFVVEAASPGESAWALAGEAAEVSPAVSTLGGVLHASGELLAMFIIKPLQ